MENYIVSIPEGQTQFFKNLFENLRVDYKKYSEQLTNDSKKEALSHIKKGFEDLKLVKQGKLNTRPAQDLLDEL
jgi:hypothetical protein